MPSASPRAAAGAAIISQQLAELYGYLLQITPVQSSPTELHFRFQTHVPPADERRPRHCHTSLSSHQCCYIRLVKS